MVQRFSGDGLNTNGGALTTKVALNLSYDPVVV
jgi:hypothetical protein